MSAPLSVHQIKVLVLYTAQQTPGPVPRDVIETALALCDVNIFGIQEAIHDLMENENIIQKTDEDNIPYLFLTEQGNCVVNVLYKDAPLSYREKALAYAAAEMTKLRKQIGVEATVCHREKNRGMEYICRVSLADDGEPWLTLSISAPNKLQADMMAERFRKNPLEIYRKILYIMTGTEEPAKEETEENPI